MFDSMSAAFMASAFPPLKALDSGDLELTASLFSRYVSSIPTGMGFVWVSTPKVKGGIDLDLVSPPLWRRLFRGEGIGRGLPKGEIWTAAAQHMRERVENAGLLTDQYADKLHSSLTGLAKRAPGNRKREFSDLGIELCLGRAVRRNSGPWSSGG
jgi:hypothetical protein